MKKTKKVREITAEIIEGSALKLPEFNALVFQGNEKRCDRVEQQVVI